MVTEMTKLFESSTMSGDAEDRESKLKVQHATKSHFRNAADYRVYHVFEKSQTISRNTTAHTGEYFKRVGKLTKAYMFGV